MEAKQRHGVEGGGDATEASVATAAKSPSPSDAGNDGMQVNLMLLVVCLGACGALIGGLVFAAQRRPDWRRTPFLGADGAE